MEPDKAVRDRAWVQREYGSEKWPHIERLIHDVIDSHRQPRLDQVLRTVARMEYATADPLSRVDALVGGQHVMVPASVASGAFQSLVVDTVLGLTSDETELVLELGSGWARNLLSVWTAGGPPTARYVAAEVTEAGRRAASLLASLDSAMRFESVEFDYHHAQLQNMSGVRHAVVFSAHSVEQIPHISPALIEAIIALAPTVACVHFEPVGWQLAPDDPANAGFRRYAEHHDYNRDLISVLEGFDSTSRIRIQQVLPQVVGVNAENPTTVVLWRAGR